MRITTPAIPFVPPLAESFVEPPVIDEPASVEPRAERTKRGIKGLFRRTSHSVDLPPPTPPFITPKSLKPLPSKFGTSSSPGLPPHHSPPGSPTDKFKSLGQTVIQAKKIQANDEVLLANLRKHSTITVADATKRLIDAESLVKAGVISTGPNASRVARDAFISAGITGLVSAPINVAAYAGSAATGEAIKAQYAPGVLPPPFLPGATSQAKGAGPASTPSADTPGNAQLDDMETRLLGFATSVMFLFGDTRTAFTKDASWPADEAGRLVNLEKLLNTTEQQLKKASRQNGLIFRPFHAKGPVPTDTAGRLAVMEQKYTRMNETSQKLLNLKALELSERSAEQGVSL